MKRIGQSKKEMFSPLRDIHSATSTYMHILRASPKIVKNCKQTNSISVEQVHIKICH